MFSRAGAFSWICSVQAGCENNSVGLGGCPFLAFCFAGSTSSMKLGWGAAGTCARELWCSKKRAGGCSIPRVRVLILRSRLCALKWGGVFADGVGAPSGGRVRYVVLLCLPAPAVHWSQMPDWPCWRAPTTRCAPNSTAGAPLQSDEPPRVGHLDTSQPIFGHRCALTPLAGAPFLDEPPVLGTNAHLICRHALGRCYAPTTAVHQTPLEGRPST